jgi:3-isopropylmalate/(R)-2-methylmalate dehydratase small subunit
VVGERIARDPAAGRIVRADGHTALHCEAVPDFLLDMVRAGGLLNLLKQRQTS